MSEHTPAGDGTGLGLSEEEREALVDWWDSDWPDTKGGAIGTLYAAVERILAARQSATEDGLRAAVEALADEWEAAMDVPERGVFDPSAARLRWAGGELRALLAAHPEPGEAASVGDGLAGVLAEHRLDHATGGTATGSSCRCSCGERNFTRGTRDMAVAKAREHVAAVIVRDWLPSEVARLRAKVERVEAAMLAAADELDAWDGHPSPVLDGCSPGGVVRHALRAALEDGDR